MTQYAEKFNLQIAHDDICWNSLKIQFLSLKFYFRTGRSSPYNFPFVSLVSSKPKQICIKKSLIKEGKIPSHRDVNVNKTLKAVNFSGSISVVHYPVTRSSHSQMFFKIGALKNVAKFTGKHLCQSLFLIKLQVSGSQLY